MKICFSNLGIGSGEGILDRYVPLPPAVQFDKEASQTRDYCVAKNATHRAARPDPSPRKERLLRMTILPTAGGSVLSLAAASGVCKADRRLALCRETSRARRAWRRR